MRGRWFVVVVGLVAFAIAAPAGAGQGGGDSSSKDYAGTALNILPSGQYGAVPPPPEATDQAKMYDDLTPLFDDISDDDLTDYFKSEALGTDDQGPLTEEEDTPGGVTITRDGFNVPHIVGETYDDVIEGAGWVTAEDRTLLIEQARYNARVAAIDAPDLNSVDLISELRAFKPSEQTEDEIAKQTKVLQDAGPKGRAVLHDIDTFIGGINAYLEFSDSAAEPWTRNDIFALNSLKGEFVGEGGGDEAKRSMFLDALQTQLGDEEGLAVFDDLRETNDPESPVSVPGSVQFQAPPRSTKGNMILDDGSFVSASDTAPRAQASNALLVSADRSANGHPLMVAGPQIGYFYPGFLLEMDLEGPGIHARGSSTAPLPGYILIGRAQDYAWSLTSAGLDIIDTYVETLCDDSDTKYLYKGKCTPMEHFEAGTLDGEPVVFDRTVHGPVVGYATVDGERVAVSRRRASYGRDTLDQLLFRDLTLGKVENVQDFFRAANQTPQTFNSFYIDDKDIGLFNSGGVPIRPPDVDPGLPIDGRGDYEWRGTIGFNRHPRGVNPPNGEIINWNNRASAGYQAADDSWSLGSIQRVELLTDNLSDSDAITLGDMTAAMNAAATQDVRVIQLEPVLSEVLSSGPAPGPREEEMLAILDDWRAAGGSRLDRELDGDIDDPGAAIMDAAWPKLAEAWAEPVLGSLTEDLARIVGPYDQPPRGQFGGWHVYMDKDLRALLDEPVKGKFATQYCGAGDLDACRESLWAAITAAGEELAAAQGDDPSAWRADATAERIKFVPGLLTYTMRYANRPSGIQQVISFEGHRPRG